MSGLNLQQWEVVAKCLLRKDNVRFKAINPKQSVKLESFFMVLGKPLAPAAAQMCKFSLITGCPDRTRLKGFMSPTPNWGTMDR